MSTSSEQQPPGAATPAHGATVHPTGPVDVVPELSGAGTSEPDRGEVHVPATKRNPTTRPGDRQAVAGLGLAALSLVLLEAGLLLGFGTQALWSTVTLWSAFATSSAVVALAAFAAFYPAGNRLRSAAIWRIAAAGLVGLSVFWVLVVLPAVASDRGFVLTAALGCLGTALWIGPRRKG